MLVDSLSSLAYVATSAAKPSLLFNYKVCGNRYRCGPAARPWENSCRNFDGEAAADETILCDHCDAQYHLAYLDPPLAAMPEHAWLCPVCANEPFRLQSQAGVICGRTNHAAQLHARSRRDFETRKAHLPYVAAPAPS